MAVKNIIWVLFLVILSNLSLYAQTRDVVHVKNGTILKGKIIYTDSNITKVEIYGGSVFVVNNSDIVKKETEIYKAKSYKGAITNKQNGFWFETNFGVPIGINTYSYLTGGTSLNTLFGWQFSDITRVALGTGIDYYGYNKTFFPTYLRLAGDLIPGSVSLVYHLDLGYASALMFDSEFENYKGGVLMNLGTGLEFNTRSKVYYQLSLGYKIQRGSTSFSYDWLEPYDEFYRFSRVELKLAIGI